MMAAATKKDLGKICKCPSVSCSDYIKFEWTSMGNLSIGCNTCCWHKLIPNPMRNEVEELKKQIPAKPRIGYDPLSKKFLNV